MEETHHDVFLEATKKVIILQKVFVKWNKSFC